MSKNHKYDSVLIFLSIKMSKRKVWVLLLMLPIIVFILSCLVAVLLSMLIPNFKSYSVFVLEVIVGLVILSILVWLPWGIVKILHSDRKWTFSIWDINRFSRAESKKKFWMFILFILTYLIVNFLLWKLFDTNSTDPIANLWWLISFLVSTVFSIWVTNIGLLVVWWHKLKYLDLFNKIKYFFHFLAAYVIYILIGIWWFILLIVPGIYRLTRFSFYQYLILDKKYGPIKALKESWKMTKGKFRDVFAYTMLLCLINVLWALCLIVWLLRTFPMTIVAKAKMYKELSK
jgi:hypothetical protein